MSIAAINGPSHTIVSGQAGRGGAVRRGLHGGRHPRAAIAVDYASHSAQVEPLREHLLDELADLAPRPATHSAVFHGGKRVSGDPLDTTAMDADYWYRNLREPVHSMTVWRALLAAGEQVFVEFRRIGVGAGDRRHRGRVGAGRSRRW